MTLSWHPWDTAAKTLGLLEDLLLPLLLRAFKESFPLAMAKSLSSAGVRTCKCKNCEGWLWESDLVLDGFDEIASNCNPIWERHGGAIRQKRPSSPVQSWGQCMESGS